MDPVNPQSTPQSIGEIPIQQVQSPPVSQPATPQSQPPQLQIQPQNPVVQSITQPPAPQKPLDTSSSSSKLVKVIVIFLILIIIVLGIYDYLKLR